MSNGKDLVPKILEKIHGEIQNLRQDTKEELSGLRRELHQEVGELRQDTTRRLDLLTEAATRTNTELVRVNRRLGKLEKTVVVLTDKVEGLDRTVEKLDRTVEKNGERFEHALITQGASHRELENRVARLEAHVGIES